MSFDGLHFISHRKTKSLLHFEKKYSNMVVQSTYEVSAHTQHSFVLSKLLFTAFQHCILLFLNMVEHVHRYQRSYIVQNKTDPSTMSFISRICSKPIARNCLKSVRIQTGASVRSFSNDDSHDDFKPKKKVIPTGLEDVISLIDQQVKENDVMLYMKGTPSSPQCGFSSQAVRILNAVGVDFGSVNVLEYPAIRDGIKVYSEWPTVPQLYVKGEFVGGCDIMATMFKEGDLEKLMKEKKVLSDE